MSKAVEGAQPGKPAVADLSFEQALKKLESIVESMESDELPLEELLSRYEEGSRMVQACQAKLSEAEVKIQQLEKKSNGQFTLKPLAITTSAAE